MKEQKNNTNKKPNWNTAEKSFYPQLKPIRDELKAEMTDEEKILWEKIRGKKLGIKFRRQHIVDVYVPDFVALSIKLIIEVDGKIHLKRRNEDAERTKSLERLGYKVIRFKNEEIENDLEKVVINIKKHIEKLRTIDPT